MRRPQGMLVVVALLAAVVVPVAAASATAARPTPFPGGHVAHRLAVTVRDARLLSGAARMWFHAPLLSGGDGHGATIAAGPSYGTNRDANDPNKDLGPGQAETAIAADGDNVMVAWNDFSAFVTADHTKRIGSGTGVAFSEDGGHHFTDLIGLRNDNRAQQWSGDPSVVAINHTHFIVGSLYLPRTGQIRCTRTSTFRLELAVEVATIRSDGSVEFTNPIVAADGGLACKLASSFLDKPFLAYDRTTRTLVMSFTRFTPFHPPRSCQNGQIEMARTHVPQPPSRLHGFSRVVVAHELPCDRNTVQQGSYPTVAPGGDTYVAWEHNVLSNQFNGNPYVKIKLARIPSGATTPSGVVAVTRGQVNSVKGGGVKSLDVAQIVGYNRGFGQDFPRIAFSTAEGSAIVEWNDASVDPNGDVWLRSISADLSSMGPIQKVNDDSGFAMQFLPAVSVRDDGTICSSWYDRRLHRSDSALTDVFAECRASSGVGATDFEVTTGSTDWLATGTLVAPNFGDYTDNASTGTTTYYTWTDGRTGIPQPFVDSN
jgi:hypothetical protein